MFEESIVQLLRKRVNLGSQMACEVQYVDVCMWSFNCSHGLAVDVGLDIMLLLHQTWG